MLLVELLQLHHLTLDGEWCLTAWWLEYMWVNLVLERD